MTLATIGRDGHLRLVDHERQPDSLAWCSCGWQAPETEDGERLTDTEQRLALEIHRADSYREQRRLCEVRW